MKSPKRKKTVDTGKVIQLQPKNELSEVLQSCLEPFRGKPLNPETIKGIQEQIALRAGDLLSSHGLECIFDMEAQELDGLAKGNIIFTIREKVSPKILT